MRIKKPENIEVKKEFIEYLGSRKLAELAVKRGFESINNLRRFVEIEKYTPLSVEDFPKIEKITDYILDFIENDKNILIYGDYDVDGITSTSILTAGLTKLSDNVRYHIPDRFKEGYGLNKDVIASYADQIDLIITCDCGISNHQEVEYAKNLGMDIVVTDHHDLPEKLPEADYIISPRLLPEDHQGYWLPGAGMAYFLIKALYLKLGMEGQEEEFLDLLLLAIIADVVPLLGENRYLFKTGLEKLKNTSRVGLLALYNSLDINSLEINEKVLAFKIAPVLNSAGRIDNAAKGLELLLADDRQQAAGIAAELKEINKRRKEISQRIYIEAEQEINKKENKALVKFSPDWHQGVVGIAAGRIVENYHVPAVLMTSNEEKNLITGSARSIEGININKIIAQCSDLLEKQGGHAAAAGFSLKKDRLEKFRLRLQRLLEEEVSSSDFERVINAELEIDLDQIEDEFYEKLRLFAPFGEANPEPLFYSEARILSSRDISQGRHKKLVLSGGEKKITALWWWAEELAESGLQKAVFRINENIYRGRHSLQLEVKALESFAAVKDTQVKKAEKEKKIKIIDLRNLDIEQLEPGRKDTVYFMESRKEIFLYPIINRNYQKKAKRLVLLTIPPSYDILKEIIILTEAEELAITSGLIEDNTLKKFLKSLMGIIKYTIKNENGIFDIEKAASFLSQKEITVKRGLEFLAAQGLLSYEYISYHELLLSKDGVSDQGLSNLKAKQLQRLLKESDAFRRYFKTKSAKKIEKTVNNLL